MNAYSNRTLMGGLPATSLEEDLWEPPSLSSSLQTSRSYNKDTRVCRYIASDMEFILHAMSRSHAHIPICLTCLLLCLGSICTT